MSTSKSSPYMPCLAVPQKLTSLHSTIRAREPPDRRHLRHPVRAHLPPAPRRLLGQARLPVRHLERRRRPAAQPVRAPIPGPGRFGQSDEEAYTAGLDWDVRRLGGLRFYFASLVFVLCFERESYSLHAHANPTASTSPPARKRSSPPTPPASNPSSTTASTTSSSPPPGPRPCTSSASPRPPRATRRRRRRRRPSRSPSPTSPSPSPSPQPSSSWPWRPAPCTSTNSPT